MDCDVGDKAAVDRAMAATLSAFGKLDIAVANAGIVKTADVLDLTEADFDAVLRVNLKGRFWWRRRRPSRWWPKKRRFYHRHVFGQCRAGNSQYSSLCGVKGWHQSNDQGNVDFTRAKGNSRQWNWSWKHRHRGFAKVATDKAAMTRILAYTHGSGW